MTEHFMGIDVGYSLRRRSTGLCLLTIQGGILGWRCKNTGTEPDLRLSDLRELVPKGSRLLGIGIDGPLTRFLRVVSHYRTSDALLSRGVFRTRGKPGQTSVPSSQKLHQHATRLAELCLGLEAQGWLSIAGSPHPDRVHQRSLLEVFPNAFLAALLPESAFDGLPALKRKATDRFWEIAVATGCLQRLIEILVPGAELASPLEGVKNHDHRAALVCALAALAVARRKYVALGDPVDGDIFLPPAEAWGPGLGEAPWAETAIRANQELVRANGGGHLNHDQARLVKDGQVWSA